MVPLPVICPPKHSTSGQNVSKKGDSASCIRLPNIKNNSAPPHLYAKPAATAPFRPALFPDIPASTPSVPAWRDSRRCSFPKTAHHTHTRCAALPACPQPPLFVTVKDTHTCAPSSTSTGRQTPSFYLQVTVDKCRIGQPVPEWIQRIPCIKVFQRIPLNLFNPAFRSLSRSP